MTLLDRLPHRPPFRFVTRLTDVQPGLRAEGVWLATGQEDFFRGHFPGDPIVPGVLLGESLAQLSGIVGLPHGAEKATLAHIDLKFPAPATPPAEIRLRSSLVRSLGDLHMFEVAAESAGVVVAKGSITLHARTSP